MKLFFKCNSFKIKYYTRMYVIFMLLLLYKHCKYLIIWVHELHVVKVFFFWCLFPRMAIWIQRLLIFLDDAKKCTLLYQFFFLLFFWNSIIAEFTVGKTREDAFFKVTKFPDFDSSICSKRAKKWIHTYWEKCKI